MTLCHPFAPRCGYCGAFLTQREKAVRLEFTGSLSLDEWPGCWRPMCKAGYEDETPLPAGRE